MTSQNGSSSKTTRAAIKDLMQARVAVAERLAGQLEKWQQAKAGEAAARERVAAEAAAAREVYDEALAAGWTAKELTSAGLKPSAPPRVRSAVADAIAGSKTS